MNGIIKLLVIGFAVLATIVFAAENAHAFDPGIPDSVLIDTVFVPYSPGGASADVMVGFITDDTVGTVQFTLNWHSCDGLIIPNESNWDDLFGSWYWVFDTILFNPNMMRHIAVGTRCSYFITNGQTFWAINIRFNILPGASPQIVRIDTITDPYWGHTLLGDQYGVNGWIPMVKSGYIRYGSKLSAPDNPTLADRYGLNSNYPNPFNAQTVIEYTLPDNSPVNLTIYDIKGQKISTLINENQSAGKHQIIWDGGNLSSGVYFYKLRAGDYRETRKMVLMK
jgi:hypothetical protein